MSADLDKVRDEFLIEAQEILEVVSRDLLDLDHQVRRVGIASDPETINSVFRGLHTLKGIAGMFGYSELADSAHRMEDLLDRIRLGRIAIAPATLDILFEGVEQLNQLLAVARGEREAVDTRAFSARIDRLLDSASQKSKPLLELGDDIVSVLTEFEEHRLQQSIEDGRSVFLVSRNFQFETLDVELEALKGQLRPHLEVITYLPSAEPVADGLRLDLLTTGHLTVDAVQELAGAESAVVEVAKRSVQVVPEIAATKAVKPEHSADSEGWSHKTVRSLRVDIDRLDHLMNIVGELGNVRGALARAMETLIPKTAPRSATLDLMRLQRAFERQLASLQDGLLTARMVPLSHTFDRVARAVRQVARDTKKDVVLTVTGASTEIDKLLVEELTEPLLHLIRNAIDHGIEPQSERNALGKPVSGTLALNAYTKGSHVVIEIEDDGRGVDRGKVLSRAIAKGLIEADSATELSDEELRGLLFLPGFSTRDSVSDLSGRGVGLDVVKNNIARLGGVVDLESEVGVYTKFRLTLPITLAIMPALVVRVEGERFALPMNAVREALPSTGEGELRVQSRRLTTVRGQTLPLVSLREHFGIAAALEPSPSGKRARQYNVVIEMGRRRLGLVVDEIVGQEDIIIKPLGSSLRSIAGFSGAADLGQDRLVLVLDVAAILDEVLASEVALGAA